MAESKFAAEQWRGINMDMTTEAVADVSDTLGVMPDTIVLFCSTRCATRAFHIKTELRCQVVLVPVEIMAGPSHWAVKSGDRVIWMEGL